MFCCWCRPAQLFPDDGLIKRPSINIDKFVHKNISSKGQTFQTYPVITSTPKNIFKCAPKRAVANSGSDSLLLFSFSSDYVA